ncbi:hypothetical protein DBR00_02530 [Pseudomonas sp. HMWF032]|nr:hypothetical protein DBR00_02530 [Pseudomonas sp. HMWF032]PTT81360.1 hypothetical protein DBR41_17000 [Pseudomonas sp. HMWF010]
MSLRELCLKHRAEMAYWPLVRSNYRLLGGAFFSRTNWAVSLRELFDGLRRLLGLFVLIPVLAILMPALSVWDQRYARKEYAKWLNKK